MKKNTIQSIIAIFGVALAQHASADKAPPISVEFEKPFHLKTASGKLVETSPGGYPCPLFADITGDGKKDILLGQIKGGRIAIFENLGKSGFADQKWLMNGEKPLEIKDVW